MSAILLVWGILITGVGVIAIGFGIPINESAIGQTLIIAGATGLVGGPVLVGIAAALSRLSAITAALNAKPAAAVAADDMPAVAVKGTADTPATTVAISATAIERLRSGMTRPNRVIANHEDVPLSPNGGQQPPMPEPKPMPQHGATPASGKSSVEALNEPRLDFLFRSRAARSPQPESFDAAWQKRSTHEAPTQSGVDDVARQPASAPPIAERLVPPALVPAEDTRSATILKSGVVDGMAYTLYADGSIEAQLPNGTVRFGSIAELRAHIENNN